MSQRKTDAVIDSVDETLETRHPKIGVKNNWKMQEDYGYSEVSIQQFCLGVQRRLKAKGYRFSSSFTFGKSLLPLRVSQVKVRIDGQTT
ncbi:MAG: hypothetical protein Q8M24_20825 [Pseudolabrys sp.]|nr:hypothetical protein [Pseudolabrys sp.]MDP2297895.1 hypothetical protein [Pseudolabrys sp.]